MFTVEQIEALREQPEHILDFLCHDFEAKLFRAKKARFTLPSGLRPDIKKKVLKLLEEEVVGTGWKLTCVRGNTCVLKKERNR